MVLSKEEFMTKYKADVAKRNKSRALEADKYQMRKYGKMKTIQLEAQKVRGK